LTTCPACDLSRSGDDVPVLTLRRLPVVLTMLLVVLQSGRLRVDLAVSAAAAAADVATGGVEKELAPSDAVADLIGSLMYSWEDVDTLLTACDGLSAGNVMKISYTPVTLLDEELRVEGIWLKYFVTLTSAVDDASVKWSTSHSVDGPPDVLKDGIVKRDT